MVGSIGRVSQEKLNQEHGTKKAEGCFHDDFIVPGFALRKMYIANNLMGNLNTRRGTAVSLDEDQRATR